MNRAVYHFNLSEIPIVADRILNNYKRDRSYFEQYSSKFNHEFLVCLEEMVNSLVHLDPIQALENKIIQSNQTIEEIINSFSPLLNITETFLQSVPKAMELRVADLGLNEFREALSKRCVMDIQRSCLKLLNQLELLTDKFLDKGFILILLSNFHILIKKLSEMKSELEEVTHRHDMIAQVYLYVDNQLKDSLETIIESTPSVFKENDSAKREEYAIENLMVQAHFRRSDCQ
jgi:hypothetical protein